MKPGQKSASRSALTWVNIAIAVCVLWVVGGVFRSVEESGARREAERVARMVTELPPGVEAKWLAYADRRFDAVVQRHEGTLRIKDPLAQMSGTTRFVSIGTPYSVACQPVFGAAVTFQSYSEESDHIEIFGPMTDAIRTIDETIEKPPALGVHSDSVAAKRLYEMLCHRLAARLTEITATNPRPLQDAPTPSAPVGIRP